MSVTLRLLKIIKFRALGQLRRKYVDNFVIKHHTLTGNNYFYITAGFHLDTVLNV